MSLTTLSDYTLLHIFGYLDATSLYQLSSISERFTQLVKTKKLWKYIDGRNNPKTPEKAGFITCNIRDNAETVLLSGNSNKNLILNNNFFNIIKTRNVANLTVLALENQHLMVGRLSEFPPTLVELSLRKSFILTSGFFKHSFQAMANLKVLVMDQCRWINTECLVSISKFRKLEILSMYKCAKVTDDDMAYLNLASYGFANLKVLDVRFTDLGNSLMRSFEGNKTLQFLYFSSFSTAYYPDFKVRSQILIKDPTSIKPHHYLDPIFDFDESDPGQFKELFGAELDELQRKEYQNLSHQGVRSIRALRNRPTSGYSPIHPSLIYTSPYPACTCQGVSCDDNAVSEVTPVKLRPIYAMTEDPADVESGNTVADVFPVTPGENLATFVARQEFTVAVDRRLISYVDRQNREENGGANRENRENRREGINGEDREGNMGENGGDNRREDGEANGEENREAGSANGENKEDKSANSEDKTDKTNGEDWENVNEFRRQLDLVLDRLGLAEKVKDRLAARRVYKLEKSIKSNIVNGNTVNNDKPGQETVNGAIKPEVNHPGCSSRRSSSPKLSESARNLLRLIELHSQIGINKDELEPPKLPNKVVVENKQALNKVVDNKQALNEVVDNNKPVLNEIIEPEIQLNEVAKEKHDGIDVIEENRVGGRKRLRETTKEESNGIDLENDEDKTNKNSKRKKGDTSLSKNGDATTSNKEEVKVEADDVKNDKKRKMDDDDDKKMDKKVKKTDSEVEKADNANEEENKNNVNGNLEEDIYGDLDDGSDGDASTSVDLNPRKRRKRSTSDPNSNQSVKTEEQNKPELSDGKQLPKSPPKLDLDSQKDATKEENQQPQPEENNDVVEQNAERVNEENDEIIIQEDNRDEENNPEEVNEEIPEANNAEEVDEEIPEANNAEEVNEEIPEANNAEQVNEEIPEANNAEEVNEEIPEANNAEQINEEIRASPPPRFPVVEANPVINRPPQLDPAQIQIRAHLLEHYYHHPPNRAFYRNHDGIIEINLRDVFREQRRNFQENNEMNPFEARHLDRNEPVQIVGFNDNAGGETPLRQLSLRGYQNVTDRSLEWLESHATQLEVLDVTYTGVTVEGLRRFKEAVGDGCRVVCADKAEIKGVCVCTPDMHF